MLRKKKDHELSKQINESNSEKATLEGKIDGLTRDVQKEQEKNLALQSNILELKQTIRVQEDTKDQLATSLKQAAEHQSSRDQLQKEVETASDYILALEEKVYKANKTSLELLKQLKDAEIEIETLKNYIIELKQRIAVYIPVKDDVIDRRLAEFINNYPERNKLKIMFMRESEGVY